MFKAKVLEITKDTLRKDQSKFFNVRVGIYKGSKKFAEKKLGFPIEMTKKQLKAELKKFIINYTAEYKRSLEDKKSQKIEEASDKTVKSMKGFTV